MNRPKAKLNKTTADQRLDIASLLTLFAVWAVAIVGLINLPDVIPMHFDLKGNVDNYGGKASIIILPVVATFVFALLTLLNRHPEIFNYVTPITDENAETEYRKATLMLRWVRTLALLVILVAITAVYLVGAGYFSSLSPWVGLPFVVLLIAVPVGFVFRELRRRKTV